MRIVESRMYKLKVQSVNFHWMKMGLRRFEEGLGAVKGDCTLLHLYYHLFPLPTHSLSYMEDTSPK